MSAPFRPPTCVCGHPSGDHVSAGTRFPHPPSYGRCLREGCGCCVYVDDREDDRAGTLRREGSS